MPGAWKTGLACWAPPPKSCIFKQRCTFCPIPLQYHCNFFVSLFACLPACLLVLFCFSNGNVPHFHWEKLWLKIVHLLIRIHVRDVEGYYESVPEDSKTCSVILTDSTTGARKLPQSCLQWQITHQVSAKGRSPEPCDSESVHCRFLQKLPLML